MLKFQPKRNKARIEDITILITGAGGFIGSHLSQFLNSRGYKVIKYIDNINDPAKMESYFRGVDFVIHLAAKCDKVRAGREKEDFITVNVLGTMNVINLCLKYNSKLIYFSSTAATTQGDVYGISKAFAEKLIRLYTRTRGLRAVIIRPCGIYGQNNMSRMGQPVDFSRGRSYPIVYLQRDIENIIENHKFSEKCETYTTKLFFNYYVLYWFKRIRNKINKTLLSAK